MTIAQTVLCALPLAVVNDEGLDGEWPEGRAVAGDHEEVVVLHRDQDGAQREPRRDHSEAIPPASCHLRYGNS